MRIIPVIDIQHGIAVRGVAGNRAEYRPLESRYFETANPVEVATGLRKYFGFNEFYVADLDAIQKRKPNVEIHRQLLEQRFDLLLDAGISGVSQLANLSCVAGDKAQRCPQQTRVSFIIGLETLKTWQSLEELVNHQSHSNLIFSLDLEHGVPIEDSLDEKLHDPLKIVERVFQTGIRRIIVLDLAQVGTGQGVTTLELCQRIKAHYPKCELITGGGIKTKVDLKPLEDVGIDGVLVASALHDGSLDEITLDVS